MGFTEVSSICDSTVAPGRIFKAAFLDTHNLLPKLLPDKIKSVEIEGEGVGSTKKIILAEDGPFEFIKYQLNEIDEQNYKVKYTVIEGAVIGEKIEKVVDTVQILPSADGGSIVKTTTAFYTIGDFVMGEDEIQMGREMATGISKVVEKYLVKNPDAYA